MAKDCKDMKEAYKYLRKHPDFLKTGLIKIEINDSVYGNVFIIPKTKQLTIHIYKRMAKYKFVGQLDEGAIVWIVTKNPNMNYKCNQCDIIDILSEEQFKTRYVC